MNNGRIRHATETFVNNLISGVKKLIESNTKQIEVLSEKDVALEEQINVLSNESEINLPISQANETIATRIKNSIAQGQLSGRYRYTSGHSSDAPIAKHGIISYKKTNQSKTTDIIFFADSGELYTATIDGVTGGYISDWRPIATTTKTDILVTPQPGYEVLYQKSYMINGITYLSVRVRKTDRTEFGIHQHSLFTIPHNVNRSALASTPYGDSNLELLGNGVVNTIAWNDRIAYAWVGSPGVYGIEVTGRLM